MKLGVVVIGVIVFAANRPSKAETLDSFTRHGLPIPGSHFPKTQTKKPLEARASVSPARLH